MIDQTDIIDLKGVEQFFKNKDYLTGYERRQKNDKYFKNILTCL